MLKALPQKCKLAGNDSGYRVTGESGELVRANIYASLTTVEVVDIPVRRSTTSQLGDLNDYKIS